MSDPYEQLRRERFHTPHPDRDRTRDLLRDLVALIATALDDHERATRDHARRHPTEGAA